MKIRDNAAEWFIHQMNLRCGGWDVQPLNESSRLGSNAVFLYGVVPEERWGVAYALAQEDFSRAVAAARAMRAHEQQNVVDMTLALLMEAQERASQEKPLERSASQAMSMGIALYAGLTKTLRQANDLKKGGVSF